MDKYMVLNKNNIAESMVTYNQPLLNPPDNYILVGDESMLWHKHDLETGLWSEEKYEPQSDEKLTEFEQMKKNNEILAKTISDLNVGNEKKDMLIKQLGQTVVNMDIKIKKLEGGN